MLAPRKKLWSTPPSAVDHIMERFELTAKDTMLDIGCGDGRILLQWAERVSTINNNQNLPSFVGIDIDEDRIAQCRTATQQAKAEGRIHPDMSITFQCANALESVDHFQNATVIFMYLIPRGLNLIYPLLKEHIEKIHSQDPTIIIRVATYMSKLPKEAGPPIHKARCQVSHQPDAAWPLYFYEFSKERKEEETGHGKLALSA